MDEKKESLVPVKEISKADPVKTAVNKIKAEAKKNKGVAPKKAVKSILKNFVKTIKQHKEKKMAKANGKVENHVGRRGMYPPKMKAELLKLYEKTHSLKEDVLGKIKEKYPEAKNLNRARAWSIVVALLKKDGKVNYGKAAKKAMKVVKKPGRVVRVVSHRTWDDEDYNRIKHAWTKRRGRPAKTMTEDDSIEKMVNVRVGGILFKVDSGYAKNLLKTLLENI